MTEHIHTAPDDREFKLFQHMIQQRLGIHVPEQKKALLSNRLWKRLQARNLSGFQDYYDLIHQPEEKAELNYALELITTNETYFFREPRHFDFLRERVLPELLNRSLIRIGSAACSSGEEIYSIAMVLADQRANGWELMGSDVNVSMLEKARNAVYCDGRTAQIPEPFRRRFCRKGIGHHAGFLRVVPDLRQKIQLRQILLHEQYPDIGKFDVVFLRNVMIYFDEEIRRQVVERVKAVLNPGGYLFVGHAESLHGLGVDMQQVVPAVYRRRPGPDGAR